MVKIKLERSLTLLNKLEEVSLNFKFIFVIDLKIVYDGFLQNLNTLVGTWIGFEQKFAIRNAENFCSL